MKEHLAAYTEKILSILRSGKRFTAREISAMIKKITPSEVGAILKRLRSEGKAKSQPASNNQHSQEWEGVNQR